VIQQGSSLLPYGNGRSYGDSCLNINGITLDTRSLNHLISFDPKTYFLRCEAGVLIASLLSNFVPKGWFVHVTPGTKFITIGGAIANDVHGKNHHRCGSFANHVNCLALLRSNGETIICSRQQNPDLFFATIGGLGLTGLIVWADIRLMPITSRYLQVETTRFDTLEQFFELSTTSELKYEYTVAWLDCASKNLMGRGIFMRANHSSSSPKIQKEASDSNAKIPFNLPGFLVNNITSKLFNSIYFNKHPSGIVEHIQDFDAFFYPLDKLKNWNRIYGKKGLFQYQCVVPIEKGKRYIELILEEVEKSGIVSSLAVLKVFGEIESKGLMSFPRQGVTLAMDFPNRGTTVLSLFDRLDNIVADAGGAVYPAKDARMSPEHFKTFFPDVDKFKEFIDPVFSSTFWRRVMA
jgi:FAD/FMN-containing dehydrogenase